MPNIDFDRPVFAVIAVLLPFIILFCRRFFRSAFSLFISLGPPDGESFKAPARTGIFLKLVNFAEIAGVFLLAFALSGPVVITNNPVYLDRGTDLLFILDCSPSMAGLDIDGRSRFEAAQKMISDFSTTHPADAIGLVGVGSDAALLVPPTTDRNTLIKRLYSLKVGELGDGTSLGTGISVAAFHLNNSYAPRKAAVLITDGENNAGAINPETAAELLARESVNFYVIAVGTNGQVPIDYIDPFTNIRRTGTFDSRFETAALNLLAESGNGTFIPAPSAAAFADAFSRINKSELTVTRTGIRGKRVPIHNFLLVLGIALMAGAFFIKKFVLKAFL